MKAMGSIDLSAQSPINFSPSSKKHSPPLIFESGSPGRAAFPWPEKFKPAEEYLPKTSLREEISGFPEMGELEVLRHFTRLSQRNFAIENQFYPLGSCTMK